MNGKEGNRTLVVGIQSGESTNRSVGVIRVDGEGGQEIAENRMHLQCKYF